MKITNKCAGEWKLFSEGLPPESEDLFIVCVDDFGFFWGYFFDGDRWFSAHPAQRSARTKQLAEEYDAYCVIQGPWE